MGIGAFKKKKKKQYIAGHASYLGPYADNLTDVAQPLTANTNCVEEEKKKKPECKPIIMALNFKSLEKLHKKYKFKYKKNY